MGAGQDDPQQELAFTTENTSNTPQRVLPTFANLALAAPSPLPPELDLTRMLHAEQSFELHGRLEPNGSALSTSTITGVYDKGSGALVTMQTRAETESGDLLATIRSGLFFRGEGGFGGERGPSTVPTPRPDREPDDVVLTRTAVSQALLYRLTGDRNPLHSDPALAAAAGFERPILHGMCTYGIAGRILLHHVAGSDDARFRSMEARFVKPVVPGETLSVAYWRESAETHFQVLDTSGAVVIDRGIVVVDPITPDITTAG